MSKINNTIIRPPFFPGNTKSSSRIKARNNPERKAELDEISKNHSSVNINQKIKDFSRIKKIVDMAPELDRQGKINELRNQIKNGTYQVNEEKIAEKILQNEY
jgi:flagellar biosynthesis anti-sigma factor FlgM